MRRLILLLLCLTWAQTASAAPALFGNYLFDAPREAVAVLPGVRQGEGDMAQDLIKTGEHFAGSEWTAQMQFENNKLRVVTLLARYDRLRFNALRAYLEKNGYEVLGLVVDERALDLFSLIKAEGMDAFSRRFRELLRAKTPERVSFVWFDTRKVSQDQKKMTNSMNEFLQMVPMDISRVEVTQLGEAGSTGPQALLVSFSYPVLEVAAERAAKKANIAVSK